jgi:hypothetical protein
MSKAHPRHHHTTGNSGTASVPIWERIPGKAIVLSLVLAAIPFATGKYIEFHTGGAFDSGAYLYSANRVLHGAIPNVTEAVTAKVGTLLLNMLGVSLFGYHDYSAKIIQMFLQMAALVTMFFVMRRVFGALAAGMTLFVASFYLSAPVIAKYGNVKEQYMIAFMMLGISMLLMRHMSGKWFWAVLAGAFLSWGPLFKETGISAIIAAFIFMVLQPLLKHRTWKATGTDLGLVILGGILAIAPVQIWISHIGAPTVIMNPYMMLSRLGMDKVKSVIHHETRPEPASEPNAGRPSAPGRGAKDSTYVGGARHWVDVSQQAPIVSRWYLVLLAPISLALGGIVARLVRLTKTVLRRPGPLGTRPYGHLVFLLGLWWLVDMALVWVSPRPWEEYFLPLCASGAMAGGYLVALYRDRLSAAADKQLWVGLGLAGLLCLVVMAWPIAFGLRMAPFSGTKYQSPSHGYVQRLRETGEKATWEELAHYIRDNSKPQDKIYVWGWYPGIYVESQRDSASTSLQFTSEMHVVTPELLTAQMKGLLESFEKEKPKYIVDTRKYDFPFSCPPLEFWPFVPQMGFLPNDPAIVRSYEAQWSRVLMDSITESESRTKPLDKARSLAEDEVLRFGVMKPVRDYVMNNYDIVMKDQYRTIPNYGLYGPFGTQVLFVRKAAAQ